MLGGLCARFGGAAGGGFGLCLLLGGAAGGIQLGWAELWLACCDVDQTEIAIVA
jgi:hypothetical protein